MPKIPEEVIDKVRAEVKKGRSRYQVAAEFGLYPKTVYLHTDDLPKKWERGKRRCSRISPAKKAWIKRRVEEGKSRYQISKELDVPYSDVRRIAKDIPHSPRPGRSGIRGKTLEMLQELLERGYVLSTHSGCYHTLRKYFPSVQTIRFKNRSICFLEDKKDEALNAFLKNKDVKVINYQDLKVMTNLFDVDLDKDRKRELIGRSKSRRSRKFQNFEDDTSPALSENSDSLADLFIRNYSGWMEWREVLWWESILTSFAYY